MLREIDVGSWSGLTRDEIAARFPGPEPPDGEPVESFRRRVVDAVTAIARRHAGESVLVVTHGGCIRSVQRHVLGDALPVLENCGTYGIAFEGGRFAALD